MLWYMKHCNYEKLKPRLIKAGMSHLRNESAEEVAYAQNMFETIFKDYPQAKDVHISSLLADLMNQKPVIAADFEALKGKLLLILPDQDFFYRPDAAGSDPPDAPAENCLRLRRAPVHRAENGGLPAHDPRFSRFAELISRPSPGVRSIV